MSICLADVADTRDNLTPFDGLQPGVVLASHSCRWPLALAGMTDSEQTSVLPRR